ncbi:MAG: hypothetical protein J6Y82_11955 [Bacteroidales bacterium]|nr:hypothetical protein [Bacteroidales bacterium]
MTPCGVGRRERIAGPEWPGRPNYRMSRRAPEEFARKAEEAKHRSSEARLFCAAERSKFLARRVRGEFFCNFSHGEKSSFFLKKKSEFFFMKKEAARLEPCS